ncbi:MULTISPECIES: MarR family transcriptional regulator [Micromonospora]|uniref:MarR family transcriptional regulator n=1 Tax=Micromonospora TaxID=1873 RepID=UPI0001BF1C53|nr:MULTISPECIES: MarR family transcriptional regulator [Micromonospora]ADL46753.1 regulatory protein MarR [Micromonospora aurantiaca ATCC 27029]MBC9006569.1 MarR family transcriptional regulator [Micromonospora aurantiaca]MDG4751741.1 MarR family transcriptional regulator [Micromonospora sp. WMMD718]OHX02246.1 transcriptional regulator [Micromonospora sp. WMMB235]RNI03017.1 MarR family transcriptional regulator [Micromonospora aurantiaca]
MERPPNLAAAIESAAEALIGVLDSATSRHTVGVSPTQLRVLSLIVSHPDTNVNRLAELLDVVPSSASRLCDRLEAVGLLRRVADPRDRREVRLIPTAAADTLLRDLQERRHRAVQAVLDRMPNRVQHELLLALVAFSQAAAATAPQAGSDSTARTA